MINSHAAIQAAIRKIHDQVGEISVLSKECGDPLREIMRATRSIEEALQAGIQTTSITTAQGHRDERNRRNKSKHYQREAVGGNEVLAEYRDDSPIPLRANIEVVQAVADILARADEPLPFEAIQGDIRKLFKSEPTEYQARIALRFLQSSEVNLVGRRNARYVALEPRKIKRAIASVLADLAVARSKK